MIVIVALETMKNARKLVSIVEQIPYDAVKNHSKILPFSDRCFTQGIPEVHRQMWQLQSQSLEPERLFFERCGRT